MKSYFIKKSSFFFIIPKGDNLTENQGGGVPGFDSILYDTSKTWYPQNYLTAPDFG